LDTQQQLLRTVRSRLGKSDSEEKVFSKKTTITASDVLLNF